MKMLIAVIIATLTLLLYPKPGYQANTVTQAMFIVLLLCSIGQVFILAYETGKASGDRLQPKRNYSADIDLVAAELAAKGWLYRTNTDSELPVPEGYMRSPAVILWVSNYPGQRCALAWIHSAEYTGPAVPYTTWGGRRVFGYVDRPSAESHVAVPVIVGLQG